jgi:hypothetical protein
MLKTRIRFIASAVLLQAAFPCLNGSAQVAKARYPAMAPLGGYLMPDSAEIALARSAAPASISGDAEVMVLRRDGYATVVKGKSGFVCIVEHGARPPTTRSAGTRKCAPPIASIRRQPGRFCRFT